MNRWVEHVRSYASQHGLSYGCALSDPQCKASYHSDKSIKAKRGKAYVDLHMIVQRAKKNQEELKKKKQTQLKKRKVKVMKGGMVPIHFDKSLSQQLYDVLPIEDRVTYNKYETLQTPPLNRNMWRYLGPATRQQHVARQGLQRMVNEKDTRNRRFMEESTRFVNWPIPQQIRSIKSGEVQPAQVEEMYHLIGRQIPDHLRPFITFEV